MRVFRESCLAFAKAVKVVRAEEIAGIAKAVPAKLKAIPGRINAGISCSNNKSRTQDSGAGNRIKGEFKPAFLGL